MSVNIANTTAGISGKTVELAESDQTITGLKTFDRDPSAPFAVSANSAVVTNLDADKLDGVEASAFLQKAGGTMTGALIGAAGTVSAPGVAVSESDCGLYSSGTNALDIATNGTKALGIDSTQFIDSPTQPRCRAYATGVQSIPNNSETAVTFDAETYDVGDMHSTVSNTSRVTVPVGGDGLYLINGGLQGNSAAAGVWRARFRKNGTTIVGAASEMLNNASLNVRLSLSAILVLAAGDYIELMAFQNSGGAVNTGGNPDLENQLTLVKLW